MLQNKSQDLSPVNVWPELTYGPLYPRIHKNFIGWEGVTSGVNYEWSTQQVVGRKKSQRMVTQQRKALPRSTNRRLCTPSETVSSPNSAGHLGGPQITLPFRAAKMSPGGRWHYREQSFAKPDYKGKKEAMQRLKCTTEPSLKEGTSGRQAWDHKVWP